MTVADLIRNLRAMPMDAPILVDTPSQTDGGSYLAEPEFLGLKWVDELETNITGRVHGHHPAVILR